MKGKYRRLILNVWRDIFELAKALQRDKVSDWRELSRLIKLDAARIKAIPSLTGVDIDEVLEDWIDYYFSPHDKRLALDTYYESLSNMKEAAMDGEEWKLVEDYPWLWVSNMGRVWSTKQRDGLMHPYLTRIKGNKEKERYYITIHLNSGQKKKRLVHRLVAEAFIPNPLNLPQVDHVNENPQDNRACNLRWVTAEQNIENYMKNHGYWYKGEYPLQSLER